MRINLVMKWLSVHVFTMNSYVSTGSYDLDLCKQCQYEFSTALRKIKTN